MTPPYCHITTIYGRRGKFTAPTCLAYELLHLDELGVAIVGADCMEQVIWVEDEYIDDMLALGYEQVCERAVFRPMSKMREGCFYENENNIKITEV